ncbi:MAG: hypothetical protein ABIA04_03240 [Pseudomonadota bacterium]
MSVFNPRKIFNSKINITKKTNILWIFKLTQNKSEILLIGDIRKLLTSEFKSYFKNVKKEEHIKSQYIYPDNYFANIFVSNFYSFLDKDIDSQKKFLIEINRLLKISGYLFVTFDRKGIFNYLFCLFRNCFRPDLKISKTITLFETHGFRKINLWRCFPNVVNCKLALHGGESNIVNAARFVFEKIIFKKVSFLAKFLMYFLRISLLLTFFAKNLQSMVLVFSKNGNKDNEIIKKIELIEYIATQDDLAFAANISNRRLSIFEFSEVGQFSKKYSIALNDQSQDKINKVTFLMELIQKKSSYLMRYFANHYMFSDNGIIEVVDPVNGNKLNITSKEDCEALLNLIIELSATNFTDEEVLSNGVSLTNKKILLDLSIELGFDISNILQNNNIVHGDMVPDNIFYDKNSRSIKLIDLEHVFFAPAVFNWFDFLIRGLLFSNNRIPISTVKFNKFINEYKNGIYYDLHCLGKNLFKKLNIPLSNYFSIFYIYIDYLTKDKILVDKESCMQELKKKWMV